MLTIDFLKIKLNIKIINIYLIKKDVIDPSITNNLMVCKSELGGDGEILEYYNI